MSANRTKRRLQLIKVLALSSFLSAAPGASADAIERSSYVVQAQDLKSARYAVIRAGGAITNDLRAIHAVNAILTRAQREQVAAEPGIRVRENRTVKAPDLKQGAS